MNPTPSSEMPETNPASVGIAETASPAAPEAFETLAQLEAWLDQELTSLEARFAAFQTVRSVTGSLGR